uniref:GDP-fucose protein O-fucosyltransferase 2 n=1 Tax=Clastoptera arizonana TaxID=38151 RepID=A0A1B6EEP3_9HEMI
MIMSSMVMWLFTFLFIINLADTILFLKEKTCSPLSLFTDNIYLNRYILYDVNSVEGFNLRRDVYMRLAIFMHNVIKSDEVHWYLVLPPWTNMHHWRNTNPELLVPWERFFDLESLRKFVPVLEMHEFLKGKKLKNFGTAYILQHYPDAFTEDFDWQEKWDLSKCDNSNYGFKTNKYAPPSIDITVDRFQCISYFGQASFLKEIINATKSRSIIFDHAEIVLHDEFGSKTYWECRRSMRFAKPLVTKASEFRNLHLQSNDEKDKTVRLKDWKQEKAGRKALGGPYLCVHWRRRDFIFGRPLNIPNTQNTAQQIINKLKDLNLNTVFIATDSSTEDFKILKTLLKEYNVVQYVPKKEELILFTDGGVAIIDQIICSHAR